MRYQPSFYIRKSDIQSILMAGHRVLDAEIYSALSTLLMVKALQNDPTLPRLERSNVYAVSFVLIEAVRTLLKRNRILVGLASDLELEYKIAFEADIDLDGKSENNILIGLSYLYHCHIRADLNLSQHEFAELCAVVPRTLRRYQDDAISEIWRYLIEEERKLRVLYQRAWLKSKTPAPPATFFGRDDELRKLRQRLSDSRNTKVMISGGYGVGKSALVQVFLHDLIDSIPEDLLVDDVSWVMCSQDIETTLNNILNQLVPHDVDTTLQNWLELHNVVIVIDNVDYIAAISDVKQLLDTLSPSCVIMTSRTFMASSVFDLNIPLNGLRIGHTQQIIDKLTLYEVSADETAHIYRFTHGNPALSRILAMNISKADRFLDMQDIHAIVDESISRLDEEAFACLLLFALFPDQTWVKVDTLNSFVKDTFDVAMIAKEHIRQDVIEVRRNSNPLTCRIYSYIQKHLYDTVPLERWRQVFEQFNDEPTTNDWLVRLLQDNPQLPFSLDDLNHRLSGQFEVQRLQKQIRLLLLDSQIKAAEAVAKKAIEQFGKRGDFVNQSYIVASYGKLLRRTGQYEVAREHFDKVLQTSKRYQDTNLTEIAAINLAQIAIDVGDYPLASFYLSSVDNTVKIEIMTLEVEFMRREYDFVREHILQNLDELIRGQHQIGQHFNLLGRTYFELEQYDKAELSFLFAVSSFEATHDILSLGRSYANLAAALMKITPKDKTKISEFLDLAEEFNVKGIDTVGLLVTHHNKGI